MLQTHFYRAIAAVARVGVVTNVCKHGWHPASIAVGALLAALICTLGVVAERRTPAWDVRYKMTLAQVAGLAVFRFVA